MAENQKGTFIVKINHTDNASWQGQVTWADKNITKNFRSTLELIKLMDGAITSEDHIRGDKKQLKIWQACVILF